MNYIEQSFDIEDCKTFVKVLSRFSPLMRNIKENWEKDQSVEGLEIIVKKLLYFASKSCYISG